MSKIPCGAFRQFSAVCCAHNLYAFGVQIPHLQPEMYFVSGTRPDTKCFSLYFLLTQKTLRGFFDSLRDLAKFLLQGLYNYAVRSNAAPAGRFPIRQSHGTGRLRSGHGYRYRRERIFHRLRQWSRRFPRPTEQPDSRSLLRPHH